VGKRDMPLPEVLRTAAAPASRRTYHHHDATMHARAAAAQDNRIGSINFGLTTKDLKQAR
jgi:hypothetical protein